VEAYGLFEQLIVDHGKEFVLAKFIHEILRQYTISQRVPVKEVTSTKVFKINIRIVLYFVSRIFF